MISLLTALLAGALSIAAVGCHKPAKPARVHVVPPLPTVAATEVSAPAKPTVLLEKGMTLSKIGKEAYGHEKFSGFVSSYNHIEDPTKLKIGAEIRTPSIPQVFMDEGMDAKYQPALNVLAKAAQDYFALLPAYRAAVKPGAAKSGEATKVAVPTDLKTKLEAIADHVEAANAVFAAAAAPHKPPQATIGQFKQAMGLLRSMANGKVDSEGYDSDSVGQRFGAGMTDVLIWTQQRHQ